MGKSAVMVFSKSAVMVFSKDRVEGRWKWGEHEV